MCIHIYWHCLRGQVYILKAEITLGYDHFCFASKPKLPYQQLYRQYKTTLLSA